jgi:hypothetical protein
MKGALDVVLDRCAMVTDMTARTLALDATRRTTIESNADKMHSEGYASWLSPTGQIQALIQKPSSRSSDS